MNTLYEILEICLKEIEQGADVDTVLFRYPEFANELRPILEASAKATEMAAPAPSQEVVRRNRTKVLQRASELREKKSVPAHRIWSVPLRRMVVSFAVVAMLFVSSTGLVRASSNTIPGDNLYPVKRTWEDVSLLFTFNADKRGALELEYENERLDEVQGLFTQGRSASVDFSGYVTRQGGTDWRVAGITISISPETSLPNSPVNVGDAVRVVGQVQNGTSVIAERIELLAPGSIVPEVEDKEDNALEVEEEAPEVLNQSGKENSGTGSKPEATVVPVVKTPTAIVKREDVSLSGKVVSIENNFVVINGIAMDIRNAEIKGTPSVGVTAKVEGYYDATGVFIVKKIEFLKSESGGSGSGSGDDDVVNENSSQNTNSSDDGNTSNDNSGDSNTNDDHGGNSGSGGGGDD